MIHPLLAEGPDGTDQQLAALKNQNPDVRQYSDLLGDTPLQIARGSTAGVDRQIGIAAFTVTFRDVEDALDFVEQARDNPETRLAEVSKQVKFGTDHPQ